MFVVVPTSHKLHQNLFSMSAKQKQQIWHEMDRTPDGSWDGHNVSGKGWLVGWCLTALSAQKGCIVPRESKSLLKILISGRK